MAMHALRAASLTARRNRRARRRRASTSPPSSLTAASAADRIHRQMIARRAEPVGDALAEDIGFDRRAGIAAASQAEAALRASGIAAEADDAAPRRALRARFASSAKCVIVAVEDRRAAGLQPLENLGLRLGDGLDAVEEFDMDRRDRGDDRGMRADELGQRRDFAGMVHADLEDGVIGIARQPRERQRHAPMIVVGFVRGMDRGQAARASAAAFPWCRSCRRCPSPRRCAPRCAPAPARPSAFSASSVSATRSSGPLASPAKSARDHGERGSGGESLREIVMPVRAVALDGEEQIARLERARIDGNSGNAGRHRAAAWRAEDFAPVHPPSKARQPCAPPFRAAGQERATVSWSE